MFHSVLLYFSNKVYSSLYRFSVTCNKLSIGLYVIDDTEYLSLKVLSHQGHFIQSSET